MSSSTTTQFSIPTEVNVIQFHLTLAYAVFFHSALPTGHIRVGAENDPTFLFDQYTPLPAGIFQWIMSYASRASPRDSRQGTHTNPSPPATSRVLPHGQDTGDYNCVWRHLRYLPFLLHHLAISAASGPWM